MLSCWLGAGSAPAHPEEVSHDEPAFDRPWQITSYTAEAGLASQRVFDIAFSPDGTVWLAAADGLRRFDGHVWERFGPDQGLPSAFVRCVLVARSGELWVGSDAGAGVFDPVAKRYDPRGSDRHLANRNVREIREDAEGALWFSCDQWPETTEQPGGLTRLKDGAWTTYRQPEGLPMDYVIGSFQTGAGQRFALTPRGWRQWRDGRWHEPAEGGYEIEPCVLHMAETPDGTVFAQGEYQLLRLAQGHWRAVGDSTQAIGTTADGELIGVEQNLTRGLIWFSVWDGARFVRRSANIPSHPGDRLYALRQAPDGAIWCVGTGVTLRWDYRTGSAWSLYPELPPPRFTDNRGRTWFHSGDEVWIGETNTLRPSKLGGLLAVSSDGTALARRESDGQIGTTDPLDPERFTPVESRMAAIKEALVDAQGGFWLVGDDAQGEGRIERIVDGAARAVASEELRLRHIAAADPDPDGGFWTVLQPKGQVTNEIVHVSDLGLVWYPQTNAPPITYPTMSAGAGLYWLAGYPGLYSAETPLGPWKQVTAFPDTGFHVPVVTRDEFLVRFTGGRAGRSGCALFTLAGGWKVQYGDFTEARTSQAGGATHLLAARGIHVRHRPGSLETDFLPLPGELQMSGAAVETEGDLWISTSDGVLRYRPGQTPPDTRISASVAEVRSGGELPVSFLGQRRFSTPSAIGFRFSWRIGPGEWSPFIAAQNGSVRIPALSPGRHALEVRARDSDGQIDPTPALFSFTVLPTPLQQRVWFIPALAALAAVIGALAWFGLARTRAMHASNVALRREIEVRRRTEEELQAARQFLEERVAERTAELTRTNQSLEHEIAERKLAEAEQHKLEDQLRQSQKMEAIGTLAGGIAHDFNNILAIIIPSAQLAIDEARQQPELKSHLHHILTASDRAKNLVQQILAFSRQRQQERRVVRLDSVVEETVRLLRAAIPSSIQIECRIAPETPPVLADTTQLHQLLMNLGTNAEHAMCGQTGVLRLALDAVELDAASAKAIPELRPGLHARIRVQDTGCGIPKETLDRIYDPFFTTKGPGQGTGLGLAVVHGVVKTHEGAIQVRSEVGRGTTFEIYLPAAAEHAVAAPAGKAPAAPRGSGQRILVVDDEPAIAKVLSVVLTRAGYEVLAQGDAREALKLFQSAPESFALVFTDLTMPGLTGLDLAREIAALNPRLPVILATGFGGDALARLSATPNIAKVLDKPLDYATIVQTVHDVLEAASESAKR